MKYKTIAKQEGPLCIFCHYEPFPPLFQLCDFFSKFLVGVFEENARLLQWLVFRQFNAIDPLFCSFVQHHQLELRTSKTYSKRQNLVQNKNIDVQNLEKHPFGVFHSDFFSALCDFFLPSLDSTKGSPLRLFRYFATQWMSKKAKRVPLLHFSAL